LITQPGDRFVTNVHNFAVNDPQYISGMPSPFTKRTAITTGSYLS